MHQLRTPVSARLAPSPGGRGGRPALALSACAPVVDVSPGQGRGERGLRAHDGVPFRMRSVTPSCARPTARQRPPGATRPLVILRCGVNVPGPTTDRCVSVNGVDWVIKEGDPVWTLTTFGREPATEILMDPDKISSATVLADLSAAAAEDQGDPELRGPGRPAEPADRAR